MQHSLEEWYAKYLWNNRYLEPPSGLFKDAAEKPLLDSEYYPYQITFKRLDKLPFSEPKQTLGTQLSIAYPDSIQISITWFDMYSKKFFGNTFSWEIPFSQVETSHESWSPRRGSHSILFGHLDSKISSTTHEKSVFFHSNLTNHHLMIVVELAEKRQNDLKSIGWSMFYPFDPSHGGIDTRTIWNLESTNVTQRMNLRLYQGTPRLLLLPSFPVENLTQNLRTFPHASIELTLNICQEIQAYCVPWPKNCFADEYLLPIEVDGDDLYAAITKPTFVSQVFINWTVFNDRLNYPRMLRL